MKKIVCLICCSVFLGALDLYESVELVLQKSHKLKEQEAILKKFQADLGVYEGNYYPKIDFSYKSGYGALSNQFGNKASLGLELNLFNGMKDKNSLEMQKKYIQSQEEEMKKVQEEVKYMTKKLYVQILLAKGVLEISKESAKLLELQLKQAQQFYKQGIWAKNNVLSVEVSLASAQLDINSNTTHLNYLLSALEAMIEEPIDLALMKDLPLNTEEMDYDRLSLLMFEYKPEYQAMQRQKEALIYEISSLKGNYYPKIDLGISGDYSFGGRYYGDSQVFVGLGVSINLFNGLKDAKRVEAKQQELLALESKISAYKRDALIELKKAIGDFNLAKDQYVLSQKAIQNAQENYRIVSNRYKQKLETSNELLDAELMLKNARANLLKSQYAIWEYSFYIEFLMGGNKGVFF
ncbi:TolC family protein [Helicobacter kayseriensis]|uniref:TolC family protein n=1 Tax=Helicobacter kayseriensis TaxID=2905877 RepID=UPI001E4EDFF2|nr:TolC family protein [Helicobacter kayseriensis]MCE3047599.1 TolC family protein [Helicobacter kayseriensis]MCE3048970.1 TolC family protein [Helicobacter kayseriensis]